jgi:predicted nucleic-acid-binding Zn-ribbon protein
MKKRSYECPKCGCKQYELDEIRTVGGAMSFNIQNKKFTVVSCSQCKYTELYKGTTSTLGNILDFFGN